MNNTFSSQHILFTYIFLLESSVPIGLLLLGLCLFALGRNSLLLLVGELRLLLGLLHLDLQPIVLFLEQPRTADLLEQRSPLLGIFHSDTLHCTLEDQEIFGFHIDAQFLQFLEIHIALDTLNWYFQ